MRSGFNNGKITISLAIVGAVLAVWAPSRAVGPINICRGGNRASRHLTCIYDGDTGWQRGVKWRLLAIDAPELSGSECQLALTIGLQARDRLIQLMRGGYLINWTGRQDRKSRRGRQLVTIKLVDGRDVGQILVQERLAQPWPNYGNVWCDTRSE